MKYKYVIENNTETNELVLKEYGEIDKDMFSPLSTASYDINLIEDAVGKGNEALISVMRSQNMFPTMYFMGKIVAAVKEVLNSKDNRVLEVFVDDIDWLIREAKMLEEEEELENEDIEIDELLEEDDYESDFDDGDEINTNSSIKVADDDSFDVDEDD